MSVEALPYTLLLLLGQFTAGSAFITLAVQVRGGFEAAYVRTCAWITIGGALLLAITVLALDPKPLIDGYSIDDGVFSIVRACVIALLLFATAYVYFLRQEDEPFLAHATGATAAGLGVVVLVLLAELVREPTWNVAGPLLMLFTGAMTLGTTTLAMIWGHWYLVNPRLPEKPLNDLSLLTLAAIGLELVVTAVNAAVPVGEKIASDALLAVDLPENPAFWLRLSIGLVFPALLAYMAYRSSRERAMMSATGLLYIAVGAILAGEALGRGLLFVTGAPV